jgi:hypothetical protein
MHALCIAANSRYIIVTLVIRSGRCCTLTRAVMSRYWTLLQLRNPDSCSLHLHEARQPRDATVTPFMTKRDWAARVAFVETTSSMTSSMIDVEYRWQYNSDHAIPSQHLTCMYSCMYVISHESTPVVMINDHIPTHHRYILISSFY